jgi:hypothetical protein
MSEIWTWQEKDYLSVLTWACKESEEALLAGNYFLVSEILRGVSNFFVLQTFYFQVEEESTNTNAKYDWLRTLDIGIYKGTLNINPETNNQEVIHPITESKESNLSVIQCFEQLNSFFDLNNLHNPKSPELGIRISELIIP